MPGGCVGLACLGPGLPRLRRLAAGALAGCGYALIQLHPLPAGFQLLSLRQLSDYVDGAPSGALAVICVAAGVADAHGVRRGPPRARVAAVGRRQQRAVRPAGRRSDQLRRALGPRLGIEQGKGVRAERRHIAPGEAFQRLRRHARNNNTNLREVCRQVLDGEVDL